MTRLDCYGQAIKGNFLDREILLALEPLLDIEEIAPLFDEELTYQEWCNLKMVLCPKYIVEDVAGCLKDLDMAGLQQGKDRRALYIMGSKSEVLDFSRFAQLEKLFLVGARKVKKVILPDSGKLQALGISSMSQLASLERISLQKGLRYLHFERSLQLTDFSFIKDLNHLLYLSFTGIRNLPELDFISPESDLRFLDFVDTNIFRHDSTPVYLKSIQNLTFLTTGTTKQKQRDHLRKELPHVCMREG